MITPPSQTQVAVHLRVEQRLSRSPVQVLSIASRTMRLSTRWHVINETNIEQVLVTYIYYFPGIEYIIDSFSLAISETVFAVHVWENKTGQDTRQESGLGKE